MRACARWRCLLLPALLAGGTVVHAAEPALAVTPARKRQLDGLACLAPPAVQAAARAASPEAFGARLAEVQASARAAVEARLTLPGVTDLGTLRVTVVAPAPLDPQQPAAVAVDGRTWPLRTCWPNGAMPSLCPPGGIAGPLADAGSAAWTEIDGQPLAGRVVLMRFGGGRNWERLFALGCAAVVVVEDDRVNRDSAEGLFCATPLPCPRFYADRATGAALAACTGRTCRLTGGDTLAPRSAASRFLYLAPNAAGAGVPPASFTVLARLDSVSAVPGAPHGAHAAAATAAALTLLDYLAGTTGLVRRCGLVFGFLDGDALGGAASRAFAGEALARQDGWSGGARARDVHALSERGRLERLERASRWLSDTAARPDASSPSAPADSLDPATARWLAETWLDPLLDQRRTAAAERRAAAIRRAADAGLSAPAREAARAGVAAAEAQIRFLVDLRRASLGNSRLPPAGRVDGLLARLGRVEDRATAVALNLAPPALAAQLAAEHAERREAMAVAAANAAAVQRVLHAIHGGGAPRGLARPPAFGWLLDLSDGTASLTFHTAADGRGVRLPAAGDAEALARRVRDVPWYAGSQAGWTESWTFVAGSTRAEFASLAVDRPPYYADFWAAAGVALVPVATANDPQPRLDTPYDTVDRLDLGSLAVQVRTLAVLTAAAAEGGQDFACRGGWRTPSFARVQGRVLRFNLRSGIDAQEPVPGAWVYYPATRKGVTAANQSACVGTRRGLLAVARRDGRYDPIVESPWFDGRNHLLAYRLDGATARFDMALDLGGGGSQPRVPAFPLLPGQDNAKDLVLTEACPFVLFPGVDPMDYQPCRGARLTDAVWQGAPAHFGHDDAAETYGETDLLGLVLYAEAGRRIGVSVPGRFLLCGALRPQAPGRGAGYAVGAVTREDAIRLPLTPLRAAQDWQALAEQRLGTYRAFGIRDQALDEAASLAAHKSEEAAAAVAACRWQTGLGAARESWGVLAKNYPRILALGREAVFSAVILMALLVPACVFLERLLIRRRGVLGRLAGAAALFAAATVFLKCFHPAFRIAVSPFIILIAFTMILMSAIVLGICYQRFDALVRRARVAGGEAESAAIGLARALATAFALGVSNLRKRPARTALTVFTVAALTFSTVAFVAVRGGDELLRRRLALDRDVDGRLLAPAEVRTPAYRGVLFRSFAWSDLPETYVGALQTEFGGRHEVVARAGYIEREGGNGADAEGVNQIEVRRGDRATCVTALQAFAPAEVRFSGLHRAVSGGAWFRDAAAGRPADRFALILPEPAAAELGITADQVLDAAGRRRPDPELPAVQMMGHTWRVAGILDVAAADRIRDVNGKSMATVDYLRSAITPSMGSGFVENESATCHMSWRQVAIVPLAARQDVRARYRSVAVRFADGETLAGFAPPVARRLNTAIFGCDGDGVFLLTARQARSVGGLAKILVPVLLCLLIVANTMMGTVDERRAEVQMLGAVGLAPRQIAFLLLSEATVYAILGIVAGMGGGLLFARVAAHVPGQFGALSFNFTSLTSTLLALGTGAVVLAATLVPARRAAALAAPSGMARWVLPPPAAGGRLAFDLPFTLTRGNAAGMAVFFQRYLLNHTDASSPDFTCRDVRLAAGGETGGGAAITARMWLAPYDLDVAQTMELHIRPTPRAGVFGVAIRLQRTSGSEEAWLRTSYRFLDGVRQQFLLWRNLEPAARRECIEKGFRCQVSGVSGERTGKETKFSDNGPAPPMSLPTDT